MPSGFLAGKHDCRCWKKNWSLQTSQHLLSLSKQPGIRLSYSPGDFCGCISVAPRCPQNTHCCATYYISVSAGSSFPNTLRNDFSLRRETAVISDSNCVRCIRSPRTCTGPKVGCATLRSPGMELAFGSEAKITKPKTLSWKHQPGSCSPLPHLSPLLSPKAAEASRQGCRRRRLVRWCLEMAPSLHEP